VTLFNPLTYLSEAVRAAVVPEVPHIEPRISLVALVGAGLTFTIIGVKGFMKRAIS
jgi:ABC-2 type transport system permease protein